MKTCFRCGVPKDRSEFYKHPKMADGLLGKCKECTKVEVRKNRADKLEYYQDYDRQRAMLPHRVSAREEYSKTPAGKMSRKHSSARYTKEHPEVHAIWARNNPRKRAAHILLGNAVRSGRVEKFPCEVCGSTERIHGHHENYDEPLNVRWLCPQHHSDRHKEMRRLGIIP